MMGIGSARGQAQKSHRYVREPVGEAIPARAATWQTVLAGQWRDFEAEQQNAFEEAMRSGQDLYKFSARGWPYHLDLRRMVQINLSTHRERTVRRVELEGQESTEIESGTNQRSVYSMLRCRVVYPLLDRRQFDAGVSVARHVLVPDARGGSRIGRRDVERIQGS